MTASAGHNQLDRLYASTLPEAVVSCMGRLLPGVMLEVFSSKVQVTALSEFCSAARERNDGNSR